MLDLPAATILVPVDFSAGAGESLQVAKKLLAPGGSLHLLHVLDLLYAGQPSVIWGTVDDQARQERIIASLRELADEQGLPDAQVHAELASGNPAHRISEVASRLDADLVVIPSRGRTGIARIALGSVAERVVRQAPCPVLVLRGKKAKA